MTPAPRPTVAPVVAGPAVAVRAPAGPEPSDAAFVLAGVTKVHGRGRDAVVALEGIDLTAGRGALVCVVGASGCGKTTLLHLLAGLDHPTRGRVATSSRAALMFQEAALFPWLTVARNVELALRLRGVVRRERRERARALLRMVHLEGFAAKRPHELSGGMRQRAALARALAQDADLLLMDEPFGALDAMTRDLLHDELESLWRDRALTVVFVTHNVREAARLADRVVVLSSRPGRVVADLPVTIERPRRIESPEVGELAAEVTDLLRAEVRRHAHD